MKGIMSTIKTPEAGIMLLIKDGKILCVSRKEDHTSFGLPGGKRDPEDASVKDTAIRETFEETDIIVKDCVFIRDRVEPGAGDNPVDYHSHCFYATDWSGTARACEDAKVEWMTEAELLFSSSPFIEYIKETLDMFKELYPKVELIQLPFATTKEQFLELKYFLGLMNLSGINSDFTDKLYKIACADQGVFDLIKMWSQESDFKERTNIIFDLEGSVKDYEVA